MNAGSADSKCQDIDTIFCAVIELQPAEQRNAYLDRACDGDAELRRQVDRLLRAHFGADDFLETAPPAAAALGAAFTECPRAESAGTVIGPYKLLEQIAEGGFGVVYMAEQTAPVRRQVALKLIKPGMDTRQVIARFEAERQALALMDHPNIAKVLDAGATGEVEGQESRGKGQGPPYPSSLISHPSSRPYFVMELVKGVPITDYCDQHQLTPRERLELFVTVCQAVQHAHQKGIIHRDIKPSNVLVTLHDPGAPGVVKVIDFGIAKATSGQLTDKTLFTGFAQLVGTPLYMSPEQASMNAVDVDTRSDIYSLGVLLYELLTGTTPFDKTRLQQATFDEVRRIIRDEEPAKPSTRLSELSRSGLPGRTAGGSDAEKHTDPARQAGPASLASVAALRKTEPRKLSQLVKGELDWIVMKCLEKDRGRRYETANGLARDVQRYLADEPVQACPPSAGYRVRKYVRRNRTALAFVLLLLFTTTALGVSNWQVRRERDAKAGALADKERALQRALTATDQAHRIAGLLQDLLESADPDEVKGPDYTVRRLLDEFSGTLGSQLAGQPEVEAELRATVGNVYRSLDLHQQAEVHLTQALALRHTLNGDNHNAVADSLIDWAMLLSARKEWGSAERHIDQALAIYRQNGAPAQRLLRGLRARQFVLRAQRRFVESEALLAEALALLPPTAEHPLPELADILHTHAEIKTLDGDYQEGERWARMALEMHRRIHGPESPAIGWALRALGGALQKQARLTEAEQAYRESLAVFSRCYGPRHAGSRLARDGLQSVLQHQNEEALAAAVQEELDEINVRIADAWLERAQCHVDHWDWEAAVAAFSSSLALLPDGRLDRRTRIASECRYLGDQALRRRERHFAEQGYRLVVSTLEPLADKELSSSSWQDLGRSCWGLGGILCDLGRLDDGEAFYRRAVHWFEIAAARLPQEGDFDRWLARGCRDLATCVSRQGRHGEAEDYCQRSIRVYADLRQAYPGDPYYLDMHADAVVHLARLLKDEDDEPRSLDELCRAVSLYAQGAADFPDYKGVSWKPPVVQFFQVRHWQCQAEVALRLTEDAAGLPEAARLLLDPQFMPTDQRACRDALRAIVRCLALTDPIGAAVDPASAALVDQLNQCRLRLAKQLDLPQSEHEP